MNRGRTHVVKLRTSRANAFFLTFGSVAKRSKGESCGVWHVRFTPHGWTKNGTDVSVSSSSSSYSSFWCASVLWVGLPPLTPCVDGGVSPLLDDLWLERREDGRSRNGRREEFVWCICSRCDVTRIDRDDECTGCCHHILQIMTIVCRQRSTRQKIGDRDQSLREVRKSKLSQSLQYLFTASITGLVWLRWGSTGSSCYCVEHNSRTPHVQLVILVHIRCLFTFSSPWHMRLII